jgi:hypothetical protein
LREKGGIGPLFDSASPPFAEKGVSAKLLPQFVMVPIALNLNASFFYSTRRELSTAVQQEASEGKIHRGFG